MALIIALAGFAGVVLFALLYTVFLFKGKSLKLPSIGMGACAIPVLVIAAMLQFEIGPFGNLTAADLDLKVGESSQFDVDTDAAPIVYESDDNAVVTVSASGTIKAVGIGSATVTATNAKGRTTVCAVNVSHVEPTAVEFVQSKYTVAPGQEIILEPVFTPANTSDRNLTYSLDKENIATVDETGTVTGISEGPATLTATSGNGITGTCSIVVLTRAEGISMESALNIEQQGTDTLEVTFFPENCAKEDIIWASSNENVVAVKDGKITGVGIGMAVITAETVSTHLTAACHVTVDYAELTIASFNSGGYSSSVMASTNGGSYFKKEIGFKPTAKASGGTGNYEYKFDIIVGGSVVRTSGWQTSAHSEFTFSTGGTYTARVTVRDSQGNTATASETAAIS